MKIRPVRAALFHEDGQTQTDMTNPIVGFRNFANAPKTYDAGELSVPATFGVQISIAESYAQR